MGRMTGILHFLTQYAWEEEKEDTRALRRARKEAPDNYDPLEDSDDDPVKACQVAIAQRMQKQTAGHLLCRTVNSKDWQGNPLVSLPPCKIVHVTLDLTPRELEIITSSGQALKEKSVSHISYILIDLIISQRWHSQSGDETHYKEFLYRVPTLCHFRSRTPKFTHPSL